VTKSEKDTTVGRDILVDGYNVIKQSASFRAVEAKSLAAAREVLISQLVNRYRHMPHQVIVVFDGSGANEQVSHDRCVRIIYSRYGETADSVIACLAAEARVAGREVEMYSDDSEVRRAVAQQGGEVHNTGQLTSQFNAAPRDVARRARHRQAMRRKYQLDPVRDPDDEREPQRSPRGKKKGPSRRRRK
jgi:predicted RNA-binding protein with PIN domain